MSKSLETCARETLKAELSEPSWGGGDVEAQDAECIRLYIREQLCYILASSLSYSVLG